LSYTLLLADDSVTTQRVLELTFAEHGVRVIGVTDGEAALERLKTERPDIVLADVGLAKVNGYKLAAYITQQPSLTGVPVLLLIGAFDNVDEERVRQSGAAGTLVKPLESGIVIKRVKELLGLAGHARAAAPPPPPAPAATPRTDGPTAWDQVRADAGLAPDTQSAHEKPDADDYLERLDAAFDNLDAQLAGRPMQRSSVRPAAAAASASAREESQASYGETSPKRPEILGREGGPTAPEHGAAPVAPEPRPAPPAPVAPAAPAPPALTVADAFETLLAAEQGQPPPEHRPAVDLTDDVIERIAARVAERLSQDVLIDRVSEIVSAVSERLVKEEIAKIRSAAQARKQ
jgi:DNA-binding response OmpR family regulator